MKNPRGRKSPLEKDAVMPDLSLEERNGLLQPLPDALVEVEAATVGPASLEPPAGWYFRSPPKHVIVDKQLIEEFYFMQRAPKDRPLIPRLLEEHQLALARGRLRPVTWAKIFCEETGITYRVDGKHTNTVLYKYLQEHGKVPLVWIDLQDYGCRTLAAVADNYATYNKRLSGRSTRVINQSVIGTMPDLDHVPVNLTDAAVAGMAYHLDETSAYLTSPEDRAQRLREYKPFVLWLTELSDEVRSKKTKNSVKHLIRSGVVAAMFGQWLVDPKAAGLFWRMVRDKTGPSPELPDRQLGEFLLVAKIGARRSVRRANEVVDTRQLYCVSITAWNAWRRGVPSQLKYFPNAPVPKII